MEADKIVGVVCAQLGNCLCSVIKEMNTQKLNEKIKQDSINRYAKNFILRVNNVEEKDVNQERYS